LAGFSKQKSFIAKDQFAVKDFKNDYLF